MCVSAAAGDASSAAKVATIAKRCRFIVFPIDRWSKTFGNVSAMNWANLRQILVQMGLHDRYPWPYRSGAHGRCVMVKTSVVQTHDICFPVIHFRPYPFNPLNYLVPVDVRCMTDIRYFADKIRAKNAKGLWNSCYQTSQR